MSKDRPRKLLVYLDQNFVSEMAKANSARVRPEFRELYEVVHQGFWREKLVVLRSVFHDVETSLAGSLRDPIRRRQSTIGHVRLQHHQRIKERQVARAVQRHLGRSDADVISFEDPFHDNPDGRIGHLDIDVRPDGLHAGAKTQRETTAAELDEARQRIFEKSTTFETQFAIEMEEMRNQVGRSSSNTPFFAAAAGVSVVELAEFASSKAFEEVPMIWLEVALISRLMTGNRKIKRGDMTDIDAMATYLPYCDVYGTDAATADLARSVKVDKKYGCALFDSRAGVKKLIAHLSEALAGMEAVNSPGLSFFVAASNDLKANAFGFFRELGNQAKMAENHWDEWVEIFGFDDGSMPQYEFRQVPGVPAPFYGLQEVVVLNCSEVDDRESLLSMCRKASRSTHFVFVDSYQALPTDFMSSALAAQKAGASQVMGYEICTCLPGR